MTYAILISPGELKPSTLIVAQDPKGCVNPEQRHFAMRECSAGLQTGVLCERFVLTGVGDRLYRRRPRRLSTSVDLETHRTAGLETGATILSQFTDKF
jgi:hypothetical protein